MSNFGDVSGDTTQLRQFIISANQFRKGTTAPTDVLIGTTPEVFALHFDATNELVTADVMMPRDVDFSVDPKLVLVVALSTSETDADTLDLTCDYTMVKATESFAKTSTQVTGQTTVTTANGLTAGTCYQITFSFARADANNPFDANVKSSVFEIHLTNTDEVGEFDLISACFAYEGIS